MQIWNGCMWILKLGNNQPQFMILICLNLIQLCLHPLSYLKCLIHILWKTLHTIINDTSMKDGLIVWVSKLQNTHYMPPYKVCVFNDLEWYLFLTMVILATYIAHIWSFIVVEWEEESKADLMTPWACIICLKTKANVLMV